MWSYVVPLPLTNHSRVCLAVRVGATAPSGKAGEKRSSARRRATVARKRARATLRQGRPVFATERGNRATAILASHHGSPPPQPESRRTRRAVRAARGAHISSSTRKRPDMAGMARQPSVVRFKTWACPAKCGGSRSTTNYAARTTCVDCGVAAPTGRMGSQGASHRPKGDGTQLVRAINYAYPTR